jgi:hypothetical protein
MLQEPQESAGVFQGIIYDGMFPSDENPEEVKRTPSYGAAYANAIRNAARVGSFSYAFENDYSRIAQNRKYARGQHSVDEFKPLAFPDQTEWVTLQYLIHTPLPKMLRIMCENIMGHPFKPRVKPYDSYVKNKYEEEKIKFYTKMVFAQQISELVNQGALPESMLTDKSVVNAPKDIEDAEMALDTSFQIIESVALEKLIRSTWQKNNGQSIVKKIVTDLVENFHAVMHCGLDHNYEFKIKYVDIPDFVSSYCINDDFSDAVHMGHVEYVPVGKFREMMKGRLTEEEIFDIARANFGNRLNSSINSELGSIRYFNQLTNSQRSMLNTAMIKLLNFEVLTSDRVVYKQKPIEGTDDFYFEKRSSTYTQPKDGKSKVVDGYLQKIYHGIWVWDTNHMVKWEQKPNQIRKIRNGKYESKPCFSYVVRKPQMLEMKNVSRCEEVIPHIKQMIVYSIKIQHWVAVAAPSGPDIDISSIVSALPGMGLGSLKPINAAEIYRQTGIGYYNSQREDGSPIQNTRPISMRPSGIDGGLEILVNLYNYELQQVKEILGVNDAVDGTQPDKRTLVGVQELAYMAHKAAIKPLQEVYIDMVREVSERSAYGCQMSIKAGKETEEIKQLLSAPEMKALQMKEVSELLFNVDIQMLPDDFEKQALKEKIAFAIQQGTLDVEDAMRVENKMEENVEQAEVELRKAKRERQKMKMEQEAQMSQMRAQEAQAIQQAEAQKEQMLAQIKAQTEAAKKDLELRNSIQLEEEKRKTMVTEMELKKELLELQAKLQEQALIREKSLGIDSPERSTPKMPKANVTIGES